MAEAQVVSAEEVSQEASEAVALEEVELAEAGNQLFAAISISFVRVL